MKYNVQSEVLLKGETIYDDDSLYLHLSDNKFRMLCDQQTNLWRGTRITQLSHTTKL